MTFLPAHPPPAFATTADLPRDAIEFAIAGPPRGKGRPRATRKGRMYTPTETRNYEALMRLHAQQAMRGRAPLEGPLRLTIVVGYPVPASWSAKKRGRALAGEVRPTVKPDIDNCIKVVDSLNGVVWADDAQVVEVRAVKRYEAAARTWFRVERETVADALAAIGVEG